VDLTHEVVTFNDKVVTHKNMAENVFGVNGEYAIL